jgi:hypothetical protein
MWHENGRDMVRVMFGPHGSSNGRCLYYGPANGWQNATQFQEREALPIAAE